MRETVSRFFSELLGAKEKSGEEKLGEKLKKSVNIIIEQAGLLDDAQKNLNCFPIRTPALGDYTAQVQGFKEGDATKELEAPGKMYNALYVVVKAVEIFLQENSILQNSPIGIACQRFNAQYKEVVLGELPTLLEELVRVFDEKKGQNIFR